MSGLSRLTRTGRPPVSARSPTQSQGHWPPADVPRSQDDRERALRDAREAARVSEEIDRRLANERAEQVKQQPQLRILLLGQSESGKSTTLKAFKLQYAPRQFAAEVDFWTAVVLLNLVRSVTKILECLTQYEAEMANGSAPEFRMSRELLTLRIRLTPLAACESSIRRRISPDTPQFSIASGPSGSAITRRGSQPELAIRAGHLKPNHQHDQPSPPIEADFQSSRRVIEAVASDMQMLWNDPTVQAILNRYHVDLQDQAGFFLDDLERIASRSYRSSIDDVLRARIRTTGAVEHYIKVETGQDQGKQWLMIDVGGHRRQRCAWASFFDNVHAIIFLAPISAFNQRLDEDDTVNRLEDTVLMWREICSNKLLKNVHMILFMNKVDILEQKLRDGIRFSDYVTNYRGENNVNAVIKYLEHKFKFIHQQHSPVPRPLGIFATSVVDYRTTPAVLSQVRSVIVKNLLQKTGML